METDNKIDKTICKLRSFPSVICKLLERLIKDHLVDFLVKN